MYRNISEKQNGCGFAENPLQSPKELFKLLIFQLVTCSGHRLESKDVKTLQIGQEMPKIGAAAADSHILGQDDKI